MNIVTITQARFGSSRFPGKVLKKIGDVSLLDIHLQRLLKSKLTNFLVVATTNEPEALKIAETAKENNCRFFYGDLEDVLDRYYQCALNFKASIVVRVTSDCPLNDATLLDEMIQYFLNSKLDYLSNVNPPTYPDGLDIEIFSFEALESAWRESVDRKSREHVTPFIRNNPEKYKVGNFFHQTDFSRFRLTVDTPDDFELISELVMKLGPDRSWNEYVNFLQQNPELLKINKNQTRNAGY